MNTVIISVEAHFIWGEVIEEHNSCLVGINMPDPQSTVS
jgi:hypothetical protein